MTARTWSLVVVIVLGAAALATLALLTPWHPTQLSPTGMKPVSSPVVAQDFTAAEQARAKSYAGKRLPPAYAGLVVGLVVSLALGLTPWGARLVDAAASMVGGGWAAKTVLGGLALLLVGRVVALPFSVRGQQVRREFGLSRQAWSAWSLDQAKDFGITAGLLVVVLTVLYALIRALPRSWPLPAALGATVLVMAVSFLYPVVVEPVFNRFTPMPQGELRTKLLALAARDDVPVEDVLIADASRRTTSLNAYVSGYGSTRRIVVYDTLVDRVPADEIEVVVAHELAHAKYGDVVIGTVGGALGAGALVGLLGLALTSGALLRRSGAVDAADPRALGLVLAVVVLAGTVVGPFEQLISRHLETRADVSALDLSADPRAVAEVHRRLALENISDPDPPALIYGLFSSHPTAPQRIELARAWARAKGLPEVPPLVPR